MAEEPLTGTNEGNTTSNPAALVCTAETCIITKDEQSPLTKAANEDADSGGASTANVVDDNVNGNIEQPAGKNGRKTKKGTTKKQSSNGNLIQIHSEHDFDKLITSKSEGSLILVEFVTTWCGACKSILPLYEELSTKAASTGAADDDDDEDVQIVCTQVICDKNKQTKKLATKYQIGSYPVFLVLEASNNGNKQIDRWEGADQGKLIKVFERFDGDSGGGGKSKKKGKKGKKR